MYLLGSLVRVIPAGGIYLFPPSFNLLTMYLVGSLFFLNKEGCISLVQDTKFPVKLYFQQILVIGAQLQQVDYYI